MQLGNSAVGGTSFATITVGGPKVQQSAAVQTATIEPKTAQSGGGISAQSKPGDKSISPVAPRRTGVDSTSAKRL